MEYRFFMDETTGVKISEPYFLIGLINQFNNRFQAAADNMFPELSWKQIFFMNCVALFEQAPSIKDMAELLGCSHQNAKQLVTRLEKQGYATLETDKADKRKQRIRLTEKANDYRKAHDTVSDKAMRHLFAGIEESDLQAAIKVLAQLTEKIANMRTGELE